MSDPEMLSSAYLSPPADNKNVTPYVTEEARSAAAKGSKATIKFVHNNAYQKTSCLNASSVTQKACEEHGRARAGAGNVLW